MGVDFMSTSVLATVIRPTPDPDRPHCVIISAHNTYSDDNGHGDDANAKLIFHSRFPIYIARVNSGESSYARVVVFRTSSDVEELRYEAEVDWLEYIDSIQIQNQTRFQAHNLEMLTGGGFAVGYDYQTNTYTDVKGRTVSDLFTLRVDCNYLTGNRLLQYRQIVVYLSSNTSTFPSQLDATNIGFMWRVTDDAYTESNIILRDYDKVASWYEYHDRVNIYNFNNPQFASGQAWLDYCKEQV